MLRPRTAATAAQEEEILLLTPEVLGAVETAAAIPPLTRTPLATLGAAEVAILPLIRAPLTAVGAIRAEETLPTRAPRVTPTTHLLTTHPTAPWTRPPTLWTSLTTRPPT